LDSSTNITGIGTISAGAITSSGIVTGTGFTAGSAVLAEAELELLDGLTAGTAIASKVVTTDSNIDTTGQRNLTITGELDAATLDISGSADIDGSLEADAYTVDGVALSTYIRDTVGTNMLSSNTESGIAVTYDTSNDNIDFALDAAQTIITSVYNASLKVGRDADNLIDFATTDNKIILRVNGVNEVELVENALSPVTSDGIALGTASLMWSDLFLASAGVINFNAGNMTITHATGSLTVAGGILATAALTTTTIVASGIIKTDATTNATSITDGSLQTDGGLSVALDVIIGDDLTLISDAAVLNFGVNSDVSLTHVHDTGLLLNSTRQLQFGDAGTYIHQSADGVLDLVSDTEIELTATNIDINGAVDVSGTFTAGSYHGDTRYIFYRLVGYDTDLEASGTAIGGDFEFPFTGTITEVGTFNDTAGSSGTQVVDIHKGGTTLMTSDKLDTDTGEKTTRTAASAPALTTTAITEGDILTFFVDAIHSTAAKGLVVRLEVTVT